MTKLNKYMVVWKIYNTWYNSFIWNTYADAERYVSKLIHPHRNNVQIVTVEVEEK